MKLLSKGDLDVRSYDRIIVALGILTALAGIGWGTMRRCASISLVRLKPSDQAVRCAIHCTNNRETRFHLSRTVVEIVPIRPNGVVHGKCLSAIK